jgi:hypothetical protein
MPFPSYVEKTYEFRCDLPGHSDPFIPENRTPQRGPLELATPGPTNKMVQIQETRPRQQLQIETHAIRPQSQSEVRAQLYRYIIRELHNKWMS